MLCSMVFWVTLHTMTTRTIRNSDLVSSLVRFSGELVSRCGPGPWNARCSHERQDADTSLDLNVGVVQLRPRNENKESPEMPCVSVQAIYFHAWSWEASLFLWTLALSSNRCYVCDARDEILDKGLPSRMSSRPYILLWSYVSRVYVCLCECECVL